MDEDIRRLFQETRRSELHAFTRDLEEAASARLRWAVEPGAPSDERLTSVEERVEALERASVEKRLAVEMASVEERMAALERAFEIIAAPWEEEEEEEDA